MSVGHVAGQLSRRGFAARKKKTLFLLLKTTLVFSIIVEYQLTVNKAKDQLTTIV